MDALFQDIRFGIRQLFRQRGSSLVAMVTLALGIGVSAALFSVIDATMLRPLPYPAPEQLVTVSVEETEADGRTSTPTVSMEDMRIWQAADDVFSVVAGTGSAFRGRIAEGAEPQRVRVQHFTEDYLTLHGVTPLLGRGFSREDTEPGAPLIALLGYGYWQSRYGGQADVLGQTIRLDDDIATIVGVLPAWFNANTPVATPLQIPLDQYSRRGSGRVSVHARLRPGVTVEQASERLTARMAQLPQPDPSVRGVRAVVTSRLASSLTFYRTTVNVLASAVALIVIIAAVNVAGLLMARGAARRSELAVRASLGAGRGRLVRQLLTESAVLAVPSAALGLLLAWLSLDLVVANLPLAMPSNSRVALNGTVVLLTLALLVPTTLLFGLAPAIRLSRVRIGAVLARGGRQVGSSLSRRGSELLIAAEIALAVILVAGAGLMIRSFLRLGAVDLGYVTDGMLTMEVLPLERSPGAHKAYYSALLHRLRTEPGIASAGLVNNFVLRGGYGATSVLVEGKRTGVTIFEATPGYHETIGATLREGRLPTDADYASGFRGAVVSASAARALFPEGSAAGREFLRAGQPGRPWTVLGVIEDLQHGGPLSPFGDRRVQIFFPLEPTESDLNEAITVVVRASGDSAGLGERLRQIAQSVGPRVLIERIDTSESLLGNAVITPRRRMVLLGLLGALGLTLALVGVFGMTGYAVTRRTPEIGVRLAFGARPAQVVRTIVRDAAVPIVAGTLAGLGGAVLATRVIESFLFDTPPRDPLTLGVVALVLASAGCAAALVPALRAAKVDPAVTLRAD